MSGERQSTTTIPEKDERRKLTPKQRFTRVGASLALGAGLTAGLAACAEDAKPGVVEHGQGQEHVFEVNDISIDGVALPPEITEFRTDVLNLCIEGDEAADMQRRWHDAGYDETTGRSFAESVAYMADFGYYHDNSETLLMFGPDTYPNIHAVAENCAEVAILANGGATLADTDEAIRAVEAYRASNDPNAVVNVIYKDIIENEGSVNVASTQE